MKKTLLILAAGKRAFNRKVSQLNGFRPNGELLVEYAICDAIKHGYNKLVFVIRRASEKEFRY